MSSVTSGGSRISRRWGHQPYKVNFIAKFSKNCMKLKELGPRGRASKIPVFRPTTGNFNALPQIWLLKSSILLKINNFKSKLSSTMLLKVFLYILKYWRKENIPVGCVLPAFLVLGCLMSLPVWFHVLSGGSVSEGSVCPGQGVWCGAIPLQADKQV